jgi:hypothetical protein
MDGEPNRRTVDEGTRVMRRGGADHGVGFNL